MVDDAKIKAVHDNYAAFVKLLPGLLDEHAGKVTLLFLDGDHSFDTVVKELELVTRIDDGAVLLHDTFYQPGSGYNHGPYEAVNDFLKRHAVEQVIHQNLGLPGMTYLKLA